MNITLGNPYTLPSVDRIEVRRVHFLGPQELAIDCAVFADDSLVQENTLSVTADAHDRYAADVDAPRIQGQVSTRAMQFEGAYDVFMVDLEAALVDSPFLEAVAFVMVEGPLVFIPASLNPSVGGQ